MPADVISPVCSKEPLPSMRLFSRQTETETARQKCLFYRLV